MTLNIGGVLFITSIFGGSFYVCSTSLSIHKVRILLSIVFGLLFVSPVGAAVDKWGDDNKHVFEREVNQIPIAKGDATTFSQVITEQMGVHLIFHEKKKTSHYFIPKEDIREIEAVKNSYLSVYERYDKKRFPLLSFVVRNDRYYIFYREMR